VARARRAAAEAKEEREEAERAAEEEAERQAIEYEKLREQERIQEEESRIREKTAERERAEEARRAQVKVQSTASTERPPMFGDRAARAESDSREGGFGSRGDSARPTFGSKEGGDAPIRARAPGGFDREPAPRSDGPDSGSSWSRSSAPARPASSSGSFEPRKESGGFGSRPARDTDGPSREPATGGWGRKQVLDSEPAPASTSTKWQPSSRAGAEGAGDKPRGLDAAFGGSSAGVRPTFGARREREVPSTGGDSGGKWRK